MNETLAEWISRVRNCIRHGWRDDCPLCNGAKIKPKPRPESADEE